MKLLEGKTAMVFGVANKNSIAWGITQALHEHGAAIGLSYANPVLQKRIFPLAESIGCTFVEMCDVSKDEDITQVAAKAKVAFGEIDILVHSIGFADRTELEGPYYMTSRAGFHLAMDISVYSYTALVQAFLPMMRSGGSVMTLSAYAADKVVPNYNVMGLAKAALEASTRYLARDLGPQNIRVNTISAGPIRTLAAMGVGGFRTMYKEFAKVAPMHTDVYIEDVGKAAVFLASDLSEKITGQVLFVDSGYNIMSVASPDLEEIP